MNEQPQLDLPEPLPAQPKIVRPRQRFAGLSRSQLGLSVGLLALLAWSAWVTKSLMKPEPPRFVAARLSNLIGEYVQAQAHSSTPPAQVQTEMKAFMSALDGELQKRSAAGQVVLVGEAVLTKNVPDITNSLREAVYASGVRLPRPEAPAEERALLAPPSGTQPSGTVSEAADVPSGPPSIREATPPTVFGEATPQVPGPAATVATFGGPNGAGDQ